MQKEIHNHQNKIAVINDFSGFGRCSIAVTQPILSELRIQCCPVPTSIFSNHTGFPSFYFDDYTERMQPYIDEWKKLGLRFEGILTGFLGSDRQIRIVEDFIRDFKDERTTVIIDPVMGDHGKPYPTYTPELCEAMRELVKKADILTPNLTEACILTKTVYDAEHFTLKDYRTIIGKLADMMESGNRRIVISGLTLGQYIGNLVYEEGGKISLIRTKRVGRERSGTGDVYASVIAADAVHGVEFTRSVRRASDFVKKCILASEALDIPTTDGVCFEEVLHTLRP